MQRRQHLGRPALPRAVVDDRHARREAGERRRIGGIGAAVMRDEIDDRSGRSGSFGQTSAKSGAPVRSPTSRNVKRPKRRRTPVDRGFSVGSCAAGAVGAARRVGAAGAGAAACCSVAPAALTTIVSTPFSGMRSPGFGVRCFPFARTRAYALERRLRARRRAPPPAAPACRDRRTCGSASAAPAPARRRRDRRGSA